MSHNVSNMGDVARMAMCRSARLHILGAEAEERSDEAHDAVLCEGLCHHFSKYIDVLLRFPGKIINRKHIKPN